MGFEVVAVSPVKCSPMDLMWKVPDDMFVKDSQVIEANHNEALPVPERLQLMHDRLGHSNYERIKKMIQLDTGEKVKTPNQPHCVSCAVARMPLGSRPTFSNREADRPLARIGSDIMGPFSHISLQGNRYILSILDFYTGYYKPVPLRFKSEAHDKIVAWPLK